MSVSGATAAEIVSPTGSVLLVENREMKQALGLAHFEGRTWGGWHHHVTLVSVAHAFCTLQRLAQTPEDAASA